MKKLLILFLSSILINCYSSDDTTIAHTACRGRGVGQGCAFTVDGETTRGTCQVDNRLVCRKR